MTGDELEDVEALLGRILLDPAAFGRALMDQVMERLSGPDTGGGAGELPGAADHDVLVDRNALLAGALGACECWGTDPACTWCAGGGTAGWAQPDAGLFDDYVTPAIRRRAADEGLYEPPVTPAGDDGTTTREGSKDEPDLAGQR